MTHSELNSVTRNTHSFTKQFTLKSLLTLDAEPFNVDCQCKHTIYQSGLHEAFICKVKVCYHGVPFMSSRNLISNQAIELRFDIGGREEFYINDFILPEDLRNIGVGSFILKTAYDLTPEPIKSGRLVIAGNLPDGKDNTPARNKLWERAVGFDNVHFDTNNSGSFKGRFLDPGDNWKNKLIVTECKTNNILD
ncbi:hypothetical protein [Vibrio owensii]|uniref:Uncharacterized protein n=1 Tax=Vibrio owensii CAIM 1854 = LMG 25443 TaxID=1229493 RepID=A0A0C1ZA19_9VIBR|nr:hypothetical protein [Vibrio owensii]KIF53019.1 hypothetical protein H735_08705 [Vibrio owensii CAIM 1854 = LMG 25443]